MHGQLRHFPKRPEGIVPPSFVCAFLSSLIGLAVSAAALVMTAPQAHDKILTRLE
jgi:hypothetical protein